MTTRSATFRSLSCLLAVLAVGTSHVSATLIYEQNFSSAPTIRISNNTNSNFAGTGDEVTANHLNQNQWSIRSGGAGSVTYDVVDENLDIVLNHNAYTLIDSSSATAHGAEYTLSFDVSGLAGSVDVLAWTGSGLDYNGTGTDQGHIFFRSFNNPPLIQFRQEATGSLVIDGTQTVSANGTFTSTPFTLTDIGNAGDYVFVGFENSGSSMTIDNLRISSVVPEPASLALVMFGGVLIIRRRVCR